MIKASGSNVASSGALPCSPVKNRLQGSSSDLGIKKELVAVLHKPPGITIVDMPGCQTVIDIRFHSVGIHPGMQLHPPLVAFINDKSQRVERRIIGCFTLLTR